MAQLKSFVADTNILVSALLFPNSTVRSTLERAFKRGELIVSESVLSEYNQVIRRKKFDRYSELIERVTVLNAFLHESRMIEVTSQITLCRDPKDNKFLELAVDGEADFVLSGDQDLLVLKEIQGIPIFSAHKFLS